GVGKEHLAGVRQRHAVSDTLEERRTEGFLELMDATADRWLRPAQGVRRFGESAEPGDAEEGLDLVQGHAKSRSIISLLCIGQMLPDKGTVTSWATRSNAPCASAPSTSETSPSCCRTPGTPAPRVCSRIWASRRSARRASVWPTHWGGDVLAARTSSRTAERSPRQRISR